MFSHRHNNNVAFRMFLVVGSLVLISVAFRAPPVAAHWQLEGEWEFSPSDSQLCDMEINLEMIWIDLPWSASMRTMIEVEEWNKQVFALGWCRGAFEVASTVVLEPSKGRFKEWKTKLETQFGGCQIDLTSKITRTSDWFSIDAEWSSAAFDLDARLRWRCPSGGCGFTFYDADCEVTGILCDTEVSVEATLTDEGFDELVIEVDDWGFEAIPWLRIDVEMTRGVDGVETEIVPTFEGGIASCIEFEARLLNTLRWRRFDSGVIDEWALKCGISSWTIEATAFLTKEAGPSDEARFALAVETDISLGVERDAALGWEGRYRDDAAGNLRLAVVEVFAKIEYAMSSVALEYAWDVETSRVEGIILEFELAWP